MAEIGGEIEEKEKAIKFLDNIETESPEKLIPLIYLVMKALSRIEGLAPITKKALQVLLPEKALSKVKAMSKKERKELRPFLEGGKRRRTMRKRPRHSTTRRHKKRKRRRTYRKHTKGRRHTK